MNGMHSRYRRLGTTLLLVALLALSSTVKATLITDDSLITEDSLELRQESASQQEEYLLYQQAREKYFNSQFHAAESLYKKSLQANPIFFPSMIGLADIEFVRKRPKIAKEYLDNALEAAPNSASVRVALGKFHYASGDYGEAETNFKKAISINANNPAPHAELAALYLLRMNRLDDSASEYRSAIKLSPDKLEYYYGLSVVLSRQNKMVEAIRTLEQAAKKQPDNPYPLELKAQLLAGDNKRVQAIEVYKQALSLDANSSSAYWALGNIYTAQKEFVNAHNAYDQFLKIKPNSALGFTKKGLVYSLQNDHKSAERTYLTAVKIDPKSSMAYNNLAHGALSAGSSFDSALGWAKKAVELDPKNPLYLDTLGWLYKKQGQPELAKKMLVKAIKSKAAPPDVYYHLGIVYADLGDTESAKRSLKKALSMSAQFEGANDAQNRLDNL